MDRSLTPAQKCVRLAVVAILLAYASVGAWRMYLRWWTPTERIQTEHFEIQSSATREQTQEIAVLMEALRTDYRALVGHAPGEAEPRPRHQLLLYRDRDEFRRCNPGMGWVEGYYKSPRCYQYYDARAANRYHWTVHEVTHQLTNEISGFHLQRWLNEGFAVYVSASRIAGGHVQPGQIDATAYPLWWIHTLATSNDLEKDVRNGSVIPLSTILAGEGGPNIDVSFNLYYLHWWTLVHFMFEASGGKYRKGALELLREGGSREAFERLIGPCDKIQGEWYRHVQAIKSSMPRAAGPGVSAGPSGRP